MRHAPDFGIAPSRQWRGLAPVALGAAMLSVLGACGPVPVAQAERNCLRDARLAKGPGGEVALGVSTDGHSVTPRARFELEVSSDYLAGRDPSDVFNRCVYRQSGQLPARPLYDQPGWGTR